MRNFCLGSAEICSLLVCTSGFIDSLTAGRETDHQTTFTAQSQQLFTPKPAAVCSPGECVALWVLGLLSWLVSELRVAKGLATGAVE